VFFENVLCERCGHMLGFVEDLGEISAFEPDDGGFWRSLDPNAGGHSYKQCQNYALERVCNRMIPLTEPDNLCQSCRLTTVIPTLHSEQSRESWYRLEQAKRRLRYTLVELGLPLVSRQDDPERGLAFEFRASTSETPTVHTGHCDGVITLNIAEADDAYREKIRSQMHEPYRTLLGHFRHEIGHYYFMRLMREGPMMDACRALFGDERADYAQALQRHYEQGPPAPWESHYISAYATMHPFEDWAETWAHYLHMFDTLETATACGLSLNPPHAQEPSMEAADPASLGFDAMIKRWIPLTYVLNSLNRSMGLPDGYPFTLAPPVIDKLRFIHRVIRQAGALAARTASSA
jgi:hypothetical protein